MNTNQMEMVSVEQLVPGNHTYRKLKKLLDFNRIVRSVKIKTSEQGAVGYGKPRLIMCLILQFMEDLSDREFERFIAENNAGKWFCGFSLLEKTPDFTTICKFRNAISCRTAGNIVEHLANEFAVSKQAMEIRLKSCGLK